MNTRILSKLAAVAIALMMNGIIIGGVAYLFDGQISSHSTVITLNRSSMHEIA